MHGHLEASVFVKLMHIGAASAGGAGLAAALGGYAYQKCGPYRRVAEPQEGEADKAAQEEVDGAIADAKKDDDEELDEKEFQSLWDKQEEEALDLMSWTICGATLGCFGGMLAGPLVCHFAWHMPWAGAWESTGIAAAFYSPIFLTVAIAGPRSVAKNLPTTVATTVGVSALLSIGVVVWPGHAHHHLQVLYYLAGCRVAASSFAAIMTAMFATRYAGIQSAKRPHKGEANPATTCMNNTAIRLGWLCGMGVAGIWMYVGVTDWAGAHYPHYFHIIPEAYFLMSVVHLLTPSPDHDDFATTTMARTGLVACHALIFIPEFDAHVAHNIQVMCGQAITALWFGTFKDEWRGQEHVRKEKEKHKALHGGGDEHGHGEEEPAKEG